MLVKDKVTVFALKFSLGSGWKMGWISIWVGCLLCLGSVRNRFAVWVQVFTVQSCQLGCALDAAVVSVTHIDFCCRRFFKVNALEYCFVLIIILFIT